MFRPYSGEYLCKGCFINSIDEKVRRSIASHSMLREDDQIAVGLSGGKDSVVLLHIMMKIESGFPKSRLMALTIDEGISGYREGSIEIAKRNASRLGVEHHIVSFKDIFGHTIDEIMQDERVRNSGATACSFCGSMRRRALNDKARELGATKLAVGHNLDDESQSILLNVFRSDISRLARLSRVGANGDRRFVPRIKPLRAVPERETILYAYFKGIEFHSQQCPYSSNVLRGEIESLLNRLEDRRPGVKYSVLKFLDDLTPTLNYYVRDEDFTTCERCGEPSSDKLCNVCKLLSGIS
jgi:uncharacterized protein (TIGR00269 family)